MKVEQTQCLNLGFEGNLFGGLTHSQSFGQCTNNIPKSCGALRTCAPSAQEAIHVPATNTPLVPTMQITIAPHPCRNRHNCLSGGSLSPAAPNRAPRFGRTHGDGISCQRCPFTEGQFQAGEQNSGEVDCKQECSIFVLVLLQDWMGFIFDRSIGSFGTCASTRTGRANCALEIC